MRRLVSVDHIRCGEWEGTEHFLSPHDWSAEQIQSAVDEIGRDMVEDAKRMKSGGEVGAPPVWPDYKAHPDKMVRDVERAHAERTEAYRAWKEKNGHLGRSFSKRMTEKGFLTIHEGVQVKAEAHWGHNHGLDLNYHRSSVDF